MLKALRRKFLWINMLLVAAVLTFVAVFLLMSSVSQFRSEYAQALDAELLRGDRQKDRFPMRAPQGAGESPAGYGLPAFAVEIDAQGNVEVLAPRVDVDGETLETLVSRVYAREKDTGFWRDVCVAYRVMPSEDGLRVAFVSLQTSGRQLRTRLLTIGLSYLAALAAFFLISRFLARWALRPVEKSWEQQRQFLANASHELKTPLTIVLANAEILEGETGPNRWLEASKAELRRMKRLIEELLFLARSDAARVPMRRETVPLSDIVWESMLSFEVVGYERRVHTTSEIQPDILLTGDADMLRRVVTILLDNATKYAPQGGSVSVSLAREQDRAVLRVHNTGQPIPQEQLDRLFDRFYRADAARAREDGGFGLGLAIARDIVDMHRGEITTGSDADGVTFCVRLPVRRDAA